jgi:hypothetical protein
MNAQWKSKVARVGIVLALYVVPEWGFARQSEGLFTPEASVNVPLLALGFGCIALRLVLLFVVVPMGAHWLVFELMRNASKSRR